MTIDKKLLEILVCPITKVPLCLLDAERLGKLNNLIMSGDVYDSAGIKIQETLTAALVTDNGKIIYPVENGVPIMLIDHSIHCSQFNK